MKQVPVDGLENYDKIQRYTDFYFNYKMILLIVDNIDNLFISETKKIFTQLNRNYRYNVAI